MAPQWQRVKVIKHGDLPAQDVIVLQLESEIIRKKKIITYICLK